MVIETFRDECQDQVYARFRERGRMLPDGLAYLNSWTNRERGVCYQLMEARSPDLFPVWFARWEDLVSFELVPVD